MGRSVADLRDDAAARFISSPRPPATARSAQDHHVRAQCRRWKFPAEILRSPEGPRANLGGPLTGAVITVPAYFDDAQQSRQRRRQACGLNAIFAAALNEPTACGRGVWMLDKQAEGTFLIYDLGSAEP